MKRLLLAPIALTLFITASVGAAPPARTLAEANEVLNDLAAIPEKGIPPALLADAQGVAIIPRVIKAGFVVGGRAGHGVVLARDKTGAWGDPVFVDLAGASVGFQAGLESTDVVLVFKTRRSLDRLLDGKEKVTLGADASVAAGPVGRKVAAATDGRLEAEIYSYSRSRGLFAGVSLDGAAIVTDRDTTSRFWKDSRSSAQRRAETLKARLGEMSKTAGPTTAPPSSAPPVPTGPSLAPPAVLGPPSAAPKRMPERQ
ncbi:MAG TPA: lipid-binding SYLF domain-containing protein [Gemmataceae bacterium]|nr:lipid-binding SYLF domain-containing protein [Gemmataceae bacterium]